jgi:hypothetical protein
MQLSGTWMSTPDCSADPRTSCSFFTVSRPMCSSLPTWSSTFGMSTLPAVRVRRVATTKPSETAWRMGTGAPPAPTARAMRRKGGLRPESSASEESVMCTSGSVAQPRAMGTTTLLSALWEPPGPGTSSAPALLLSSSAQASTSSGRSSPPASPQRWSYWLPSSTHSSSVSPGTSSPRGSPVARSITSHRMGASHLAASVSLTRYLPAKLTEQRRCGLCSHSTQRGSRQPRLLRGEGAKIQGRGAVEGGGGEGSAGGRVQVAGLQRRAASGGAGAAGAHWQSWRKTSCRSRVSRAAPE